MTDFESSLPIKTLADGDVGAVLVDKTTPAQSLAIDSNGSIKAVVYGNNGSADVVLPIDATSGALKVDLVDASGIVIDVDIDQFINGHLAVPATDKANVVAGYDGANYRFLSTDTNGVLKVAEQNPPITGDTIHVYGTAADLAKDGTTTITHTVTAAKTFYLKGFGASGSGKVKAVIDIEAAVKQVKFSSSSDPNCDGVFAQPIAVAAGDVVTLTITNRDSTQDVYGYINGEEI